MTRTAEQTNVVEIALTLPHASAGPGFSGLSPAAFSAVLPTAVSTIKSFHGDLAHDVRWMDKHDPTDFYWGFGRCGTHIGTDLSLIESFSDVIYHVTVV